MTTSTLEIILKISSKHFNKKIETLSEDTHIITDLHGDSLDAVELVMLIEDHFKIDVPEEQMSGVRTLGGISTVIEEILRKESFEWII